MSLLLENPVLRLALGITLPLLDFALFNSVLQGTTSGMFVYDALLDPAFLVSGTGDWG